MEQRLGLVAEAYTTGRAHRLRRWSEYLTVGGAVLAVSAEPGRPSGRGRGLALLAGSALQRFGVFEAGVASTKDPKYVVVPQRERLDAGRPARGDNRPGPQSQRFTPAARACARPQRGYWVLPAAAEARVRSSRSARRRGAMLSPSRGVVAGGSGGGAAGTVPEIATTVASFTLSFASLRQRRTLGCLTFQVVAWMQQRAG